MRPVRVVLQAFGPFAGREVIDFRELGDNRFFLVHGPTGAGKTTVLDAMCFALYGRTTGEERTAQQMRSQFAAKGLPTEIEFDFSVGSECYRIRRRPAQQAARARGTGTRSEAPSVTLWRRPSDAADDTDGEPVATKGRDVAPEVERIIGFSADQFRQVVMLPQGRFRELLSADSKQREQIMQALFGTGRYASVEARLKERRRDLESGLEHQGTRRSEVLREAGVAGDAELLTRCTELAAQAAAGEVAVKEAQAAAVTAAAELTATRTALEILAAVAALQEEVTASVVALMGAEVAALPAREVLSAQDLAEGEREDAQRVVRELEMVSARVAAIDRAVTEVSAAVAKRDAAAVADRSASDRVASRRDELAVAQDEERAQLKCAAALPGADAALQQARRAQSEALRLVTAEARCAEAQENRNAAADALAKAGRASAESRARLDKVRTAWVEGRAAALASGLEEGRPCPVCGSLEHPSPAIVSPSAADGAALDTAESEVALAEAERMERTERLAQTEAALAAAQAERETVAALSQALSVDSAEELIRDAQHARDEASRAEVRAREAAERGAGLARSLEESARAAESAARALQASESALASASATLAEREREVPEELRLPGALGIALQAANDRAAALQAALKEAQKAARDADLECRAAQERADGAARALATAKKRARGVQPPDVDGAEGAARTAEAARDEALEARTRADEACARATRAKERLAEIDATSGDLTRAYGTVAALADAAVGQNPLRLSFQRYVLGVFLTEVLDAATRRLVLMTRGRYRLHMAAGTRDRRSAGGLDLEVFDEYTGDDRPVSTLSGGEGFLASLSLALGLAEVVESLAGGVHLDTVFVDEGFGTLDEEALETAIQALMELQGRGRLVGIISHVPELQRAIPARLEITSTPSGSSARFVVP